jgi:anti-sigma regulatory factor (Ser/Thr protein kinase)
VNTYRALFPSTFASVAEARQAVGAFAFSCGFSPVEISDIVLAVGEACSNAAEHGHVERGHFTVGCVYHRGMFRAEVRDRGPGFDPAVMSPSAAENAAPIGRGRGIPIMRALMDRVTYGASSAGTAVVLEKRMRESTVLRSCAGEPLGELSRLDARNGR